MNYAMAIAYHEQIMIGNHDCIRQSKIEKKRGKKKMKTQEYVFRYKVFSLPYWYEFVCYADSTNKAITMFLRENPIGIESYRILMVKDI